jgi:carboxymethylenebutenolidase
MKEARMAGMERLTAADGHEFDCWIEPPTAPRRGGLAILQEIFGVTDQLKGVARHYAALGYEVAIPALFDRKAPGTVVAFTEAPKGRDLMLSLVLEEVMQDVAATVARLGQSGGKVAVLGFCWGGGLAVRAAQVCNIAGAVALYGTRLGDYMQDELRCPLQFHAGATDDHTPPEMCARLTERFPGTELHVYEGAGHAFANDARATYVAQAAETAHARAAEFLAKVMG